MWCSQSSSRPPEKTPPLQHAAVRRLDAALSSLRASSLPDWGGRWRNLTLDLRTLPNCKACRRPPRNGSSRCIDDELQVRIVIGLETCVRKTQHALLGMTQALHAARPAANIVGFPPFCKLRAAVSKTG